MRVFEAWVNLRVIKTIHRKRKSRCKLASDNTLGSRLSRYVDTIKRHREGNNMVTARQIQQLTRQRLEGTVPSLSLIHI